MPQHSWLNKVKWVTNCTFLVEPYANILIGQTVKYSIPDLIQMLSIQSICPKQITFLKHSFSSTHRTPLGWHYSECATNYPAFLEPVAPAGLFTCLNNMYIVRFRLMLDSFGVSATCTRSHSAHLTTCSSSTMHPSHQQL